MQTLGTLILGTLMQTLGTLIYRTRSNSVVCAFAPHHLTNTNITRFSEQHNLLLPKVNTNYGKHTALFSAIALWNSLPVSIKSLQSQRSFTRCLKSYLLEMYLPNLEIFLVCTIHLSIVYFSSHLVFIFGSFRIDDCCDYYGLLYYHIILICWCLQLDLHFDLYSPNIHLILYTF